MSLEDLPDETRTFERHRLLSFEELFDLMFENVPEEFSRLESQHSGVAVCYNWDVKEIREQGLFGEIETVIYKINYHLDLSANEFGSGTYHCPDLEVFL